MPCTMTVRQESDFPHDRRLPLMTYNTFPLRRARPRYSVRRQMLGVLRTPKNQHLISEAPIAKRKGAKIRLCRLWHGYIIPHITENVKLNFYMRKQIKIMTAKEYFLTNTRFFCYISLYGRVDKNIFLINNRITKCSELVSLKLL